MERGVIYVSDKGQNDYPFCFVLPCPCGMQCGCGESFVKGYCQPGGFLIDRIRSAFFAGASAGRGNGTGPGEDVPGTGGCVRRPGREPGEYFPGEYQGAGCKIFETFEEGDKLAVYALIEYIEYGFEDGRFVNVSGTRARVLLDFQTGQDTYALTGYTVLDPTSGLSDAELEALMAPLKETGKEYLYTDSDFDELRGQVEAGTEEYLKSIGREGEVFERDSHDDGFISFLNDKAYNALTKDLEISNYPNWEGTLEKIEDGIRYVYQAHFDAESNQIEYTKTNYDTGETVEKITADAAMGERIP